jgi:hypothetical protein
MQLLLENVRCFYGRHEITIRPLTLLVGENSSGKTTTLAMLSAALTVNTYGLNPDFSAPPFDLGGYESIASKIPGREQVADAFGIGFFDPSASSGKPDRILATFFQQDGKPELGTFEEEFSGYLFRYKRGEGKQSASFSVRGSGEEVELSPVLPELLMKHMPLPALLSSAPLLFSSALAFDQKEEGKTKGRKKAREKLPEFPALPFDNLTWAGASSVAPIRSKPSRIYETRRQFAPEGDHIPFLLAELCQKAAKHDKEAEDILGIVRDFGRESGLFRDVDVKRLEEKAGAPFRLMINSDGLKTNLTDVGYGISQVLPVLLEAILHKDHRVLLQQPEVHLHPSAQAALGTLLARLVSKSNARLVIETHSDYIVDRIRQEVANGEIVCSDVAILYFERKEGKTEVHCIDLDALGNLVNAPSGYRQFFLEEEYKILTGGK